MSQEMGVLSMFNNRTSAEQQSAMSFVLRWLLFLPRVAALALLAAGFVFTSLSTSVLSYIAGLVAAGLPFDKFIWDSRIGDWTWHVGFCSLDEFVYRNWLRVDWGCDLELYKTKKRGGRHFPAGPWRIDFLARDTNTNDLVVIHQAKSGSSDATVGKLLKHIAWVKENVAEPGQNVRGMIVTRETDTTLEYAVKDLKFVEVRTYSTSIDFNLTLKPAKASALAGTLYQAPDPTAETTDSDSTTSNAVAFSFDAADEVSTETPESESDESGSDTRSSKSKSGTA